jgi:hypothetical protein
MPQVFDSYFTRARLYAPRPAGARAVREESGRSWAFPYSERHLQCVWFDNALRPAELRTTDGERVVVEDPGVWNLEAGPDFHGAALRIGPDRRRMAGDVEIHIHPSDWRQHGHQSDPRYARVRVHVTYFPGALPEADLPPGAIQISLKDALAARPGFSFENVDLVAYPFALRAPEPPCLKVLRHWNADRKTALLDAAGEERLRRKSERMARRMREEGPDQVLYEDVMSALGFKHNKNAFRQLALRLPHDTLRAEAAGREEVAYALLAGVSGLLPATSPARWEEESKAFARRIWDAWWKRRERYAGAIMPRSAWRLAGIRPANHPLRRLMAAALLFSSGKTLASRWNTLSLPQLLKSLTNLRGPYFDRHATLGGRRLTRPAALIGADRAEAIAINVFAPFLAAAGVQAPFDRGLLDQLPPETDNAIIRQTALNLFGPDHGPSLYRTGLRRQGLIQIFHDYCLDDRSRCAACTFPALLAREEART